MNEIKQLDRVDLLIQFATSYVMCVAYSRGMMPDGTDHMMRKHLDTLPELAEKVLGEPLCELALERLNNCSTGDI